MTGAYEEAYARGFHDAQDKARVEGRLVIVDSPELVALRARIEELEAENARLNALCDQMKIGWGEDAVRAEAAEADLATARNDALEAVERVTPYKRVRGEPGYSDQMCARKDGQWLNKKEVLAAIRALKSTTQP